MAEYNFSNGSITISGANGVTINGNGIVTGAGVVKGNGKMATVDYSQLTETDITGLALSCSADIQINIDPNCKKSSILLSCEENLKDLIDVVSTSGTLQMKMNGSYMTTKGITLEVVLPSLEKIKVSSSGAVSGNYIGKDLEVQLTGSGSIKLVGQAESLDAKLMGSGDILLKKLPVTNGNLVLQGSGDIVANISGSANLVLQGSGDIEVHGNPTKVEQKLQGSGDINVKKGSAPKANTTESKSEQKSEPFHQRDNPFGNSSNVFGDFNTVFSNMDETMKDMERDLDRKMAELNTKMSGINTGNIFHTTQTTVKTTFPSDTAVKKDEPKADLPESKPEVVEKAETSSLLQKLRKML